MTKSTAASLRELFLSYFEEKEHLRVPSSSLVPKGDPTLLFTTAGMVPMKPYFLGEAVPPGNRLTSVQKSFRTTDVESVGDATHLTFFEMLGNFSIGDYFKEEAIQYAWEFCTKRVGLRAEKLWVTVLLEDDEAQKLWEQTGVPSDRIRRYGEEDNFWGPAGDSGPCGPCSEIHYQFRDEPCDRPDCGPNCECGRFVEIWNLVFMQFDQAMDGTRSPLPKTNIDTGMSLERLTAVVQGVASVYETDLFRALIEKTSELSGKPFGENAETDRALRTVVEHSRAAAFLIADGVVPGNEGRGYVLRRVLRRCIRFAKRLGITGPFLAPMIEEVIEGMGSAYPELVAAKEHILVTACGEEARFQQTLSVGDALLENIVDRVIVNGGSVVSGEDVFRLHDTYGFPLELTEEVVAERGLSVDLAEFDRAMLAQRERGRAGSGFTGARGISEAHRALSSLSTRSLAHDSTEADSSVTGLTAGGAMVTNATELQEVEVVAEATPFYAESGGQVGDIGTIVGPSGRVRVSDTQRPVPDAPNFVIHVGMVEEGRISVGDAVRMEVDRDHRTHTKRHHTATHLLHAALRQVLGAHVRQAGSLVAPDHLRFDFSHNLSLNEAESAAVTRTVNERVLRNISVRSQVVPIQQALSRGALAFFGDRYGDIVRTVEIDGTPDAPPFSLELCAGTHVHATGEIGFVYVTSESSIGSGMRRVEAVAGSAADTLITERLGVLNRVARQLGVTPDAVADRAAAQLAEADRARKRVEVLERELAASQVGSLLERVEHVHGVALLAARVDVPKAHILRDMTDDLRRDMGSGVIVLGSVINDKPSFVCVVTADLVGRGPPYHAGQIVKGIAAVAGGDGGGRSELATAGGRDPGKLDEALATARNLIASK